MNHSILNKILEGTKRLPQGNASDNDSEQSTLFNGRYELEHCLGTGERASVYYGRNLDLFGHPIAVKVVLPEFVGDDKAEERLRKELTASYLMTHPNIIRIYECFRCEERIAFAMEYIDGGSLYDFVQSGERLSIGSLIHILSQLCSALEYMHSLGIVHSNLKAENILLTENRQVKITSFGDAYIPSSLLEKENELSNDDASLVYDFIDDHASDPQSDIVSIGALAYEMITGENPFPHDEILPMMTTRLLPEFPRQLNPACPSILSEVVMKALQSSPGKGYENVYQMKEELKLVRLSLLNNWSSRDFNARVPTSLIKRYTHSNKSPKNFSNHPSDSSLSVFHTVRSTWHDIHRAVELYSADQPDESAALLTESSVPVKKQKSLAKHTRRRTTGAHIRELGTSPRGVVFHLKTKPTQTERFGHPIYRLQEAIPLVLTIFVGLLIGCISPKFFNFEKFTHRQSPPVVTTSAEVTKPSLPEKTNSEYTVTKGDSISSLAKRFSIPEEELISTNNIRNPGNLHVGDILTIPAWSKSVGHSARSQKIQKAHKVRSNT